MCVCSSSLQQQLDGLRNSFEYISDYVNSYGLKIWQANERLPLGHCRSISRGDRVSCYRR